jgi:mutator family transposase
MQKVVGSSPIIRLKNPCLDECCVVNEGNTREVWSHSSVWRLRWPSISATGRTSGPVAVRATPRNGAYDKTVVTEIGEVELRVPRDRQGTFEPVTVPKYQRRLDGLSGNVISLYAKGFLAGLARSLAGIRGGGDSAQSGSDHLGLTGLHTRRQTVYSW